VGLLGRGGWRRGLLLALLPVGVAGLVVLGAEQPVEIRERGRLALVVRIVGVGIVVGIYVLQIVKPAEGVHHIPGEIFDVLVGQAHFVYYVVHGLYVELPGALQAEPLLLLFPVFDFGDEDHRYVFTAARAKCRLHISSPMGTKKF